MATQFSRFLKGVRINVRLTQIEFAKKLDVKLSTYKAWETGRSLPKLCYIDNLKEKFKELNIPNATICELIEFYTLTKNK